MRCKRNMLFCVYVWIQKKDKNQSNKLLDYCFNDNVIYCTDLAWFFPSNQCIFWLNPSHFTDIPIFIASIFLFSSHLIRHFYNTMHTDLRKNYKKNATRTYMKQTKEKFPFYACTYVFAEIILLSCRNHLWILYLGEFEMQGAMRLPCCILHDPGCACVSFV